MSAGDEMMRVLMEQAEATRTYERLVRESEEMRARIAAVLDGRTFMVRQRLDGKPLKMHEC